MEKIAEGYYRFNELVYPCSGVSINMCVDKIDGECLDTNVDMEGNFAVAGSKRVEFAKKLGELIEEYRI